ncbi:hypothetical protein CCACVL1_26745 [Corchorus capsularis]|uniref:Uncharacterized protein n=1 Tax=Corchorus capsularis TaxID=210143 RepID=A0A1R3GDG3_COCAP|nr:hypothetical protein CCACVL1_26745 [Corchorus capsularis]
MERVSEVVLVKHELSEVDVDVEDVHLSPLAQAPTQPLEQAALVHDLVHPELWQKWWCENWLKWLQHKL